MAVRLLCCHCCSEDLDDGEDEEEEVQKEGLRPAGLDGCESRALYMSRCDPGGISPGCRDGRR